jgi:hypothetical protein
MNLGHNGTHTREIFGGTGGGADMIWRIETERSSANEDGEVY